MRGWPLVELCGLTVALALLVIPLHAFTLGRHNRVATFPEPVPALEANSGERTAVQLFVRFAHPPLRLRVSHAEETIWELKEPVGALLSDEAALLLGATGIDLRVEVEWPPGTPESVVELTLEPDGLETRSRTAWGKDTVDAILIYTWP